MPVAWRAWVQRMICSRTGPQPKNALSSESCNQPDGAVRHLFRAGKRPLRDALYVPALVAIRFTPCPKTQYARMKAEAKPSKFAIIATMRNA